MDAIENQAAFVLHTRPYSDSSLIVHLFSQDFGRMNVLAKGARSSRSKRQPRQPLQVFTPYLVNWQGKRDLKTLTRWEAHAPSIPLQANSLYSGLYINELLLKLLPEHDRAEGIFYAYQTLLPQLLEIDHLEVHLRGFEFLLLEELGYGLDWETDSADELIQDEGFYQWHEGGRFVRVAANTSGTLKGQTLFAIGAGDFSRREVKSAAKALMRHIFWVLLDRKPLKTREFIRQMQS